MLFASCEKYHCEICFCVVGNPMQEVKWLKEYQTLVDTSELATQVKITQFTYQRECVFLVEECFACPDAFQIVYNYKKEEICRFGGFAGLFTCPGFFEEARHERIILNDVE